MLDESSHSSAASSPSALPASLLLLNSLSDISIFPSDSKGKCPFQQESTTRLT